MCIHRSKDETKVPLRAKWLMNKTKDEKIYNKYFWELNDVCALYMHRYAEVHKVLLISEWCTYWRPAMSRSTQSAPEIQMTNCRINNPKFSPVITAWNIYFWKNLFVVFILYIIIATASWKIVYRSMQYTEIVGPKVIMQGKLFQRCTHLLYCSVRLWAVM